MTSTSSHATTFFAAACGVGLGYSLRAFLFEAFEASQREQNNRRLHNIELETNEMQHRAVVEKLQEEHMKERMALETELEALRSMSASSSEESEEENDETISLKPFVTPAKKTGTAVRRQLVEQNF